MFGTRSRHTRRHYTTTTTPRHQHPGFVHHASPNHRAGGLKAALDNPKTSFAGRRSARNELHAMGRVKEAHLPLCVRIKRMLGIRSHNIVFSY